MRRTFAVTFFALVFVLTLGSSAFADPGNGKALGHAKQSSTITEDNDSDGQPNTPDPQADTDNDHPSGNDRSDESGNSENQGDSGSTPDQDGQGPERDVDGTDKPGNDGGADELDQDGNNGCGNDDDFEDDNEGRCGGNKADDVPPPDDGDDDNVIIITDPCEAFDACSCEDDGSCDHECTYEECPPPVIIDKPRPEPPRVTLIPPTITIREFDDELPKTGMSLIPLDIFGGMFILFGLLLRALNKRLAKQH